MIGRIRGTYMTNSGMACLWSPTAFVEVVDYDTWEEQLLDDADIRRHIGTGGFVPINIRSDGVYEIEVRVGRAAESAVLSDREKRYEVVRSEPYLFRSTGRVCVSGIEYVAKDPGDGVGAMPLSEGDYVVTVHLIGWDQEPEMRKKDGMPKKAALPDFVVLINRKSKVKIKFRKRLETFPRPK